MTVAKFFGILVSGTGGRGCSLRSERRKKAFAIRGVPVNNAGPRSQFKPLREKGKEYNDEQQQQNGSFIGFECLE
jgi:hypothetical protein